MHDFRTRHCNFSANVWQPKCEGQVKEHPGLTTSQSSPLRLSFVGSAHRLSTELGTGYSAPGARSRGNTWSVECAERGDTHKTTDYRCQHLFWGTSYFLGANNFWRPNIFGGPTKVTVYSMGTNIFFGDQIFLEDIIFVGDQIFFRHNICLNHLFFRVLEERCF